MRILAVVNLFLFLSPLKALLLGTNATAPAPFVSVQELCESRGGRPELSVLTSLLVSVDVKNY